MPLRHFHPTAAMVLALATDTPLLRTQGVSRKTGIMKQDRATSPETSGVFPPCQLDMLDCFP
jgi:hypothetical protein